MNRGTILEEAREGGLVEWNDHGGWGSGPVAVINDHLCLYCLWDGRDESDLLLDPLRPETAVFWH